MCAAKLPPVMHCASAQEDDTVYEFYVRGSEVRATLVEALKETLREGEGEGVEKLVEIVYQPQAKFRVQAVTHCTSSIPGRGERRRGEGREGGREGKEVNIGICKEERVRDC